MWCCRHFECGNRHSSGQGEPVYGKLGSGRRPTHHNRFSLIATVAAAIHKARIESCLSTLQTTAAKLEGIAVMLEGGFIEAQEAARRYDDSVAKCPPVPMRRASADTLRGGINSPAPGQAVNRTFEATGWAEGVGKGVFLWLAIEVDGKIWPKEGHIFVDNQHQWVQPVYEDGLGKIFALSLWAANAAADRTLCTWLSEGQRTGEFPPLTPPPGARRLSRVDGLCLSSPPD